MKLWLLRPQEKYEEDYEAQGNPWAPWFDKTFGFVVRAETEGAAREFAQSDGGDEVREAGATQTPWLDPEYSSCIELVPDGEAGVVIHDEHWA